MPINLTTGHSNRISFEIEVLRLQPGDVVTLKVGVYLTKEQVQQLERQLKKQLPDGIHVIILSGEDVSLEASSHDPS
jgi:hypothetical protein